MIITYNGDSKIIKKICELLNVTDVKVNNTSVVDENGVANITVPDLPLSVVSGKVCITYDDGN